MLIERDFTDSSPLFLHIWKTLSDSLKDRIKVAQKKGKSSGL